MVLDYAKAMNLLKLPVGEKWYTSERKAHRLVLHRTTLGVDTVMVWPEYVAGKGFNETTSALIGELYHFSTGAGHLFIYTDGCCSEFLNWGFVNLFDKLVQWRWFHRISWCVFIKGHSSNLCDAAARAMDRALQNVDYCYGLTDMSLLCPSSLFAVLALVPPGVAPAFCVSVLLLPLSVGATGCPCRAPPPVPPTCPPPPPRTRISCLRTTWTVPCAVGWSRPCCHPRGGHLPARGCSPRPCGVCGHLVEGGGGRCLLVARSACAAFGGCCSARTSWFHCVLLCVLLGLVSLLCVGRL